LKERDAEIRVIGADPEGSVLSGDAPKPWKVEGIGEDFLPKTMNGQVVDEWVRVGDAESFRVARDLARREGMLVGGSSGTAVAAALRYTRRLSAEDIVVVLCPDTGRNYLSKFFDDDWMAENHLLGAEPVAETLADLLKNRGPRVLVTVTPDATMADAVDRMQSQGISQLPVLRDGQSVGSIQEVTLARLLHDHFDPKAVRVADVMARALPQVDSSVHLDEAYRLLLAGNSGVLAMSGGQVVGIITRIDLIQYWNRPRPGGGEQISNPEAG
jgi:cystathionine beta-synthase